MTKEESKVSGSPEVRLWFWVTRATEPKEVFVKTEQLNIFAA